MAGGQRHAPAALPPGKTRYPLYWGLSGPQGPSGRVRKISSHRDSIPGPSSPWRMYVCVYTRVCVCVCVYIHTHTHTHTHRAMTHIKWTFKETWFRRPKQTLGPALGHVTLRFISSWIRSCVVGWVILDVSKHSAALVFRIKQSITNSTLPKTQSDTVQTCTLTKIRESQILQTTWFYCTRRKCWHLVGHVNPLMPNDSYMSRTAPLTSKRCILYVCSTNVGTEYFKHAVYSPFFFLFKMQFVS